MHRKTAFAILLFLFATGFAIASEPIECDVVLGKKGVFGENSRESFAPKEKIFARIKIKDLQPGQYSFHTEWINPLGELQDESAFSFEHHRQEDFRAQSWMRLIRAGFFKRLASVSKASGYSAEFFGRWQVVFYLNGEKIASRHFDIL